MRKAQKKQAEDFLKILGTAQEELKKLVKNSENAVACDILSSCQQGAIELGCMIEKTEGEGTATVSLLEEYCEAAYQLYEQLSGHVAGGMEKPYKRLCKLLIKIENSVRHDVKVRREVVFLPYKASMWDSLESVWLAAKEDEGCDAYVVPIPYYDKNPDGSFREMHYEGGQYPADVPITDYMEYDLESRYPDVIFIHNPYDEFNLVTSVEPRFFSKNLKKYTDNLVYIPYFILDEVRPDEEEKIEKIKHFVTVPAVFHSAKTIVQSEDMKRVYVKVLMDEAGDHSEKAKKYWEHRILGLGSPKIDKVLSARKEDYVSWMEKGRRRY